MQNEALGVLDKVDLFVMCLFIYNISFSQSLWSSLSWINAIILFLFCLVLFGFITLDCWCWYCWCVVNIIMVVKWIGRFVWYGKRECGRERVVGSPVFIVFRERENMLQLLMPMPIPMAKVVICIFVVGDDIIVVIDGDNGNGCCFIICPSFCCVMCLITDDDVWLL